MFNWNDDCFKDAKWLENLVPSIEGSDELMINGAEGGPSFSNVTVKISDVSPDGKDSFICKLKTGECEILNLIIFQFA